MSAVFRISFLAALLLPVPALVGEGSRRYHLDANGGDDARSGLSPEEAWRSLGRASSGTFAAGDEVLLKRGGRWEGTLAPQGSGTPERPIRISAYGDGPRPLIDGGDRPAVLLEDQEGWVIDGLEVTNRKRSGQDALKVRAGARKPHRRFIRIRNCVAHGAGGSGIHVGEEKEGNHDDVTIEDCLSFDNQESGIFIQGSYFDRARGLAIRRSVAHGNGADGIKIYSGQDGVIEHSTACRNGWKEDARVGIWCWNSDYVTIQLCESYENRTPGTQDGGGFDIDWACTRCVIQFCYSHDNEGAGILFMGAGETGMTRDSSVRFNVSQNDGRRNRYGGIVLYGDLRDSQVHNNAVYLEGSGPGAALQLRGDAGAAYPRGVRVFNNILVAAGGREALSVPAEATRQNAFDYNAYSSPTGLKLIWGESTFSDLEGLQRATGQESRGIAADPRLRAAGQAGLGRLPLEAYRLLRGSPCLMTGAEYSPTLGRWDYWNTPLSAGVRTNIGPHQGEPSG